MRVKASRPIGQKRRKTASVEMRGTEFRVINQAPIVSREPSSEQDFNGTAGYVNRTSGGVGGRRVRARLLPDLHRFARSTISSSLREI